MRIIYMGTPAFAVPTLAKLHHSTHKIVGVITAPDRPSGRGQKLTPSPVKVFAEEHGLHVMQPEKLRNPVFLEEIQQLAPDLMIVVAFRMLPKLLWSIPQVGTFNLHASLLPNYRGAAPINWAIMEGETETGLTTFFIDEQIDTGRILLQEKIEIPHHWTAGDLHDDMMERGADLVLRTVEGLANGSLKPKPQEMSEQLTSAPKIFKADCKIHWNQAATNIYHFIRGLSPYPASWTTLNDKTVKIFWAKGTGKATQDSPGTIWVKEEEPSLWVATADNWLSLERIQLEGRKPMNIEEFLRGYKQSLETFI